MKSMFFQCHSLKELDVSSFDTSNVTDMGSMFFQCGSLEKLDLSSFNTEKVTSFTSGGYGMFTSCSKLKELDIRNFDLESDDYIDFGGTPSGMTVYVKDEATKEIILNLKSNANVIIPESI